MKVVEEIELKQVPRWMIEEVVASNKRWVDLWSEESNPRESGPRKKWIKGLWRAQVMAMLFDTSGQFLRLQWVKQRGGSRIETRLYVQDDQLKKERRWLQVLVEGRCVESSQ